MSDLQHSADDDYDRRDDGPIYDEKARRRLSPLARMLVIAAIIVAGVAFAALVWFAYNEGVRSGAEEAAPVLRADAGPVKHKPEDAGGMAIPHQDKLVYNRIAPGQAQQPVERLLPPPETPVERPTPPAEPAADAAPPPVPAETPKPAEPAIAPATGSIAQVIAEAGKEATRAGDAAKSDSTPFVREPDTAKQTPSLAAPEAPPQQAAVPPAPKPEAPAATGPVWHVQLASLTSEAAARKEWARMQKANEDLLGALALNLQTVSLSKGTFYRIQAGPFADRTAADKLCGALKSRKQDCLVVAP